MSSTDNFAFSKQFRQNVGPCSGSKLFDTLIVFQRDFFLKKDFRTKSANDKINYPVGRVNALQILPISNVFNHNMLIGNLLILWLIFFPVECGAGTYYKEVDGGQAFCENCPVGTYQDQKGQDSCIPCNDGYTTQMSGSYEPSSCSGNWHKKHCHLTLSFIRYSCKAPPTMNDYIHVHRTKKLFVRSTRGHKLDPGPVPYFHGDGSWNNFYGYSL